MSDSDSKDLYTALLAVQAAAPTLPKDREGQVQNRKYRYTTLDTILETLGPLLREHGLLWSTMPSGTHDEPTLIYGLRHLPSGEAIAGTMPLMLDDSTAQKYGSALTYARRYAISAVLNLVADDDDDGQAASASTGRYGAQRQSRVSLPPVDALTHGEDGPDDEQARRIKSLLRKNGITRKEQAANLFRAILDREPEGSSFVASLKNRVEADIVIARLVQGAIPDDKTEDIPSDPSEFDQPPLPAGEPAPFEGARS